MLKFRNKYRIPSTRLQKWDYGWNAKYFVTIKTKNGECYFGNVGYGEIFLSAIGEIVKNEWLKTPVVRPDMNIIMDEFVIMPNHFHAIIGMGKNQYNKSTGIHKPNYVHTRRDAMHCVSTPIHHEQPIHHGPSPIHHEPTGMNDVVVKNKFGPQSKNLPSIIRGFKSAVTINARKINPDFAWQPRYYDIIIRDNKTYNMIRKYIIDNPENWCHDDFHN